MVGTRLEIASDAVLGEALAAQSVAGMDTLPAVQVDHVSKRFGGVVAVDGVSLQVAAGEFFALLGPSGCGKTTLLRMIAGLEVPSAGRIRVAGEDVSHRPAHKRPVHMVFQHYALFPHLTVTRNVGFGLRYQGIRGAEAELRIEEALSLVQLEGYGARLPSQLSGGQRQRVALARALVLRPKVLLLDEPLSALDQKLRREMQLELKRLQRSLGITFVFVTHDQEEALTMSDRIAVLNHGRIEQLDAAERVFERPVTRFVAEFMGAANFMAARVVEATGTAATVASDAGYRFTFPTPTPSRAGRSVRFIVRPEKLLLLPPGTSRSDLACMEVEILDRAYQGVSTVWTVQNRLGERLAVFEQNDQPPDGARLAVGGRATVCWHPRHTVVIDDHRQPDSAVTPPVAPAGRPAHAAT
jgi:spermidine/putrescine transport system ATP-binding protein